MAVFLIDYENVQSSSPLYGIEDLTANDRVVLFYSDCAKKICRYYWDIFCSGKCSTRLAKLVKPSKNALDFYIAVEVGRSLVLGEKDIAIISNDKGYGAVIDYVKAYSKNSYQQVIRTSCIAEASKIFQCQKEKRVALVKSLEEITSIDAKRPGVVMKFESTPQNWLKIKLEKLNSYFRKRKEVKNEPVHERRT